MADKGREVKATFKADTANFEKGSKKVKDESSTLERALKKLGPVGSGIQGILDKIGLSSLSGAAGLGIATAALGAGVATGEKAIDKYTELVGKIDDYQDVTGQSAEASSRQVQAFEELGISSETAGAGMFKLSQAIAGGEKNLEKYGIEVVKDSAGNVDLNGTLLNVMNAYQGTADIAQKNAIVFAAFGKSGAALIPILETNTAELKGLESAISKVVTDEDIARVREYKIAQKEAQRSADDWGIALGEFLLPKQKAIYDNINENIYVQKRLAEAYRDGTLPANASRGAVIQLVYQYQRDFKAAQDAQAATDRLSQTQQEAADAALQEEVAEQKLADAIHSTLDDTLDYRQSLLDLKKAQKDATDAHGKNAEANLRLERAYIRVADAARRRAIDQAAAKGQVLDANAADLVWAQSLDGLIKKLDSNSPLRKELQGWINQLKTVPRNVTTTIGLQATATARAHAGSSGLQEFAEGGTVAGPTGSPQLAVVHGGETVVPAGKGAAGTTIVVNIHGGLYSDGPGLDRLTSAIAQRLRMVSGI